MGETSHVKTFLSYQDIWKQQMVPEQWETAEGKEEGREEEEEEEKKGTNMRDSAGSEWARRVVQGQAGDTMDMELDGVSETIEFQPDKKKISEMFSIKLQRAGEWEKESSEAASSWGSAAQIVHIPECRLELWINSPVALSSIIWKREQPGASKPQEPPFFV